MSLNSKITLRAPATSANLGPGFDVFGVALHEPNDVVTIKANRGHGIKIELSGIQSGSISSVPENNTAGVVAKLMMQEFNIDREITISLKKGIWPGKGLGSSAAPAAAVAFGMNLLFKLKLSNEQLIRYAAKGEIVSAGSEHADNVSAAICGNFVILKEYDPLELITFKAPSNLMLCLAFPDMITSRHKTQKARAVVPTVLPIDQLVRNIGNAAALVAGFAKGDVELIGRSMKDIVVEPARAPSIPGYLQVKENALMAGACGVTISGAGPAIIAVINKERTDPAKVVEAMKQGFKSVGLKSKGFATILGEGVSVIGKTNHGLKRGEVTA